MNKQETKFKETEIGLIPEDWELKPVNFFCLKITSGGTPSRTKKEFWENGKINWLKTKELMDGNIYTTEEKISEDFLHYIWKNNLFEDDLIDSKGHLFEIISTGMQNTDAGPDFFNAKIKFAKIPAAAISPMWYSVISEKV